LRLLTVFGTRPEAIKMAPVVRALAEVKGIESEVCSTGQHREMLKPIAELFALKIDHDLAVMRAGQDLNALFALTVRSAGDLLVKLKPDRVLVHGDTTTAAAVSLAAFHLSVPVAHVEAGLRTHHMAQPWPEEMNRRLVDLVADILFAPTEAARRNLESELAYGKRIVVTGNTVIDALLTVNKIIDSDAMLRERLRSEFGYLEDGRRLILVTGHRRENFGDGFRDICSALIEISKRPDIQIVYPIHLNPDVRQPVLEMLTGSGRIRLIDPVGYLQFVYLMRRATLLLTDSGGIQEEAPSLGKPVLVMRNVTERPEAIAAGTARLVGTSPDRIVPMVMHYLDSPGELEAARTAINPYGDGRAAERIVAELVQENA
jgi:UDP-N-acetylglucosamine 2-epimerase (non-hydrolysing)